MKTKILDVYDYAYRSYTRNSFYDTEWGFAGTYVHKDLGQVSVALSSLAGRYHILMLDVISNGKECHRNIELNKKCTYRFAGLQAKKFLEDIEKENFIPPVMIETAMKLCK